MNNIVMMRGRAMNRIMRPGINPTVKKPGFPIPQPLGPELLTLDADGTAWTDDSVPAGASSWSNFVLTLSNGDGTSSQQGVSGQAALTEVGKTYRALVTRSANSSIVQLGGGLGASDITQSNNGVGAFSWAFVATSTNTWLTMRNFNNSPLNDAVLSDMSVKEVLS